MVVVVMVKPGGNRWGGEERVVFDPRFDHLTFKLTRVLLINQAWFWA